MVTKYSKEVTRFEVQHMTGETFSANDVYTRRANLASITIISFSPAKMESFHVSINSGLGLVSSPPTLRSNSPDSLEWMKYVESVSTYGFHGLVLRTSDSSTNSNNFQLQME